MENKNQKNELASRVSILYYKYNKNQNEVASELGISRSYVSQLLSYAKDNGLVEIKIHVEDTFTKNVEREITFARNYNLRQALILESSSNSETKKNLNAYINPYITSIIKNSKNIGINLGDSVKTVISGLNDSDFNDCSSKTVVQIMGGFNQDVNNNSLALPSQLVNQLGNKLNCKCMYLNSPAVIENKEIRNLFLKEKTICEVIKYWEKLDLVIMGIGVADEISKTYSMLSNEMKEVLKENKACCDININYFDEDGNYLGLFEEKRIGISYEQLKKVKNKIVIGYGKGKVRAIASGLRANIIDILITDSITADAVDEYYHKLH